MADVIEQNGVVQNNTTSEVTPTESDVINISNGIQSSEEEVLSGQIKITYGTFEFPEKDDWGPRRTLLKENSFRSTSKECHYINHARVLDAMRATNLPIDIKLAYAAAAAQHFKKFLEPHFVEEVWFDKNNGEMKVRYNFGADNKQQKHEHTFEEEEVLRKYHIPTLLGYDDPDEYRDEMQNNPYKNFCKIVHEKKENSDIRITYILKAAPYMQDLVVRGKESGITYAYFPINQLNVPEKTKKLLYIIDQLMKLRSKFHKIVKIILENASDELTPEENVYFSAWAWFNNNFRAYRDKLIEYLRPLLHGDEITDHEPHLFDDFLIKDLFTAVEKQIGEAEKFIAEKGL